MSIRYTLRLAENGAEVWKRWTGDREEALRDLVTTVTDLDVDPQRAENFALAAQGIDPDNLGGPGSEHTAYVYNHDMTVQLGFTVRKKG